MTLKKLREMFWSEHRWLKPKRKLWKQGKLDVTVYTAWLDYVKEMERDGTINAQLAQRATL
ncbi:MAG: hypothetical protein WC551_10685 [Patescibacteria group bacterium]|jgi:hypothetical protein